jgi:hypothetical protein
MMKHWGITGQPATSFENKFMTIRTYSVTMPNGKLGEYGVVETHSQAVTIVALDDNDRVAFIHEERFPVAKITAAMLRLCACRWGALMLATSLH